jgi:hypothetical protein
LIESTRLRRALAEDESVLFETVAHNLKGEPDEGEGFYIFLGRNPLKSLDSKK